jgi:hypothetical protein
MDLLIWKLVEKVREVRIQGVPGVKDTTSGFNSRSDSESKRHTHRWVRLATVQEL